MSSHMDDDALQESQTSSAGPTKAEDMGYEDRTPKRKKPVFKRVWFWAVIAVALVVLITFGLHNSESSSSTSSSTPLSDDEIASLYSGSTDYKGRTVTVSGKVFNVKDDDDFQLWHDPANSAENTLVTGSGISSGLTNGDYVTVTGTVGDPYNGTNAFGATVKMTTIKVASVEKSSYKDVVAPTIKEVDLGQTINQEGCQITVDKIEFAANETRVYVTATNTSDATFTPYGYSSHLVQNGAQINVDSSLGSYVTGYDQLSTNGIVSGASSSGIIVFPAIDQADCQFVIGGYCSNYKIKLSDFSFSIAI